ncbi:MAG: histidinol-phosphatase HisJ family protein [Clostridia bacterium]|nr:histidinol-phosphatase HisJ family protein [Clostridia bacterium]
MHYLVDYHVHTDNSFDSNARMEDYCRRAIEIGLKEIAFTEHFDLNPKDKGLGYFNFEDYSEEIEKCREMFGDRLKIKKGLELGEPHLYLEEHESFLRDKDFDFLLGSVHFIGERVLHREYAPDEDEREVYLEYFEQVLETARKGNYHSLGHLDVLKRYVPKRFKKFYASQYQEIVREILTAVINRSRGIEINTSCFRQGLGEPLPTIEIIKWYKELGGQIITIGTDAHHVRHLGQGLNEGMEILKDLGFKGFYTFTQGEPHLVKF